MKQICLILFLITIKFSATAQIATTNWSYQLEIPDAETSSIPAQKSIATLKLLNKNRFFDSNYLLGHSIKNAVEEGILTIYKDQNCTKVYILREMDYGTSRVEVDTVTTFDAETFKEEVKIVKSYIPIYPGVNIEYRLSQDWFIDENTNQLSTIITKIGIEKTSEEERRLWFAFENQITKAVTAKEIEKSSVIWAKSVEYDGNFEGKKLDEYVLTPAHLAKHLLIDPYTNEPLSVEKAMDAFGPIMDTIITFDPETFAEEAKIVRTEGTNIKDIKKYRVAQDFYYDEATKSIGVRLLGIAPLIEVYDKAGEYRYSKPFFWIVYDKDFLLSAEIKHK